MSWQEYDRQRFEAIETKQAKSLVGSKTWNPAATAATQGAEVSTTVAVPGALVGSPVIAGHSVDIGATTLVAAVTAADTVTVRLINTTAAAVDVASGTLAVKVWNP